MGFWKKPTAVRISRTIQNLVHRLPFQLFTVFFLPAIDAFDFMMCCTMRVVYCPILYCAMHRVHALQSAQPRHTDTVNHNNNHWDWINTMICCVKVAVCKSLFMFCSQPSCKPVVLNKYVLMFGLHHMGCIVSVCILSGCLVAIGCLKYGSEMERTCINSHILTAWLSSNLYANP